MDLFFKTCDIFFFLLPADASRFSVFDHSLLPFNISLVIRVREAGHSWHASYEWTAKIGPNVWLCFHYEGCSRRSPCVVDSIVAKLEDKGGGKGLDCLRWRGWGRLFNFGNGNLTSEIGDKWHRGLTWWQGSAGNLDRWQQC